MRTLASLTAEVDDWIGKLLPKRDPFDTTIKMVDECSELLHAQHHAKGDIAGECADILILLLDVAFLNGVDLQSAFEEKMEINRNRKWDKKQGTLKHVKGESR